MDVEHDKYNPNIGGGNPEIRQKSCRVRTPEPLSAPPFPRVQTERGFGGHRSRLVLYFPAH